jgi:hypothetical protein
MKRLSIRIADEWQSILAGAGIVVSLVLLYFYRLASLTAGFSSAESNLWHNVAVQAIKPIDLLRDAVYLPYTVWLFVLQYMPINHAWAFYALRGFSALMAIVATGCIYILIKHWYSQRIALLSVLLFATSSWLLHAGRTASADSLYLLPLVVFAAWSQLQTGIRRSLSMIVATVAGVLCLYVPGLVWVVVPAFIWQRKFLSKQLRSCPPGITIAVLAIGSLLMLPLIVSIAWPEKPVTTLLIVRELLGIPVHFPSVATMGHTFVDTLNGLFFKSNGDPLLFTGKAPLVSFFSLVMIIIGLYDLVRNSFRLDRTKILVTYILIGFALITINSRIALTILLPPGFILVANGMRYMLQDWLRVFPRNPVARTIGASILGVAVFLTVSYNFVSYFIAWPHTPAVKQSYTHAPAPIKTSKF